MGQRERGLARGNGRQVSLPRTWVRPPPYLLRHHRRRRHRRPSGSRVRGFRVRVLDVLLLLAGPRPRRRGSRPGVVFRRGPAVVGRDRCRDTGVRGRRRLMLERELDFLFVHGSRRIPPPLPPLPRDETPDSSHGPYRGDPGEAMSVWRKRCQEDVTRWIKREGTWSVSGDGRWYRPEYGSVTVREPVVQVPETRSVSRVVRRWRGDW